jgi:hypothetical protein
MSEWENAGSRSSSLPPALIGLDEFQLVFLGGVVSTRARLRFTNRGQCAVNSVRWSRIFQRTAKYLLTGCLTPGGKYNFTVGRFYSRGCSGLVFLVLGGGQGRG